MPEENQPLPYHQVETWFQKNQRNLPWRSNRTPYRVWLSEIMLQQTQVAVVIDYFNRFLEAFPTIHALSNASEDQVLALWSGLGYYSRGRNLHKTAQIIVKEYNGIFPDEYHTLLTLPGIGSYTAGAILTFAFQKPAAVVDGNIARVLARIFHDKTQINSPAGKKHYEALSLDLVQKASSVLHWQEGLMEIGALICKSQNPRCNDCPLKTACVANSQNVTHQIPQKIRKAKRQPLNIVCAIIHNENEIWLEKNSQSALLKGLYAPPNAIFTQKEHMTDTLLSILKARHIQQDVQSLNPIHIKRTLTHLDLNLFGFLIYSKKKQHASDFWFQRELLHQIGLSKAIRTLIECSLDKKTDLL